MAIVRRLTQSREAACVIEQPSEGFLLAMNRRGVFTDWVPSDLTNAAPELIYCLGAEHGLFRQELGFNRERFTARVHHRNLARIAALASAFGRPLASVALSLDEHMLSVVVPPAPPGKSQESRGAMAEADGNAPGPETGPSFAAEHLSGSHPRGP